MPHPLHFIPDIVRKRVFLALLTGTLVLFAVFQVLNVPLTNPVSTSGIVSFELAGTPERAKLMIDVWTNRVKVFTLTDGEHSNATLIEPSQEPEMEFSEETSEPFIYNPIPMLYAAFGLGLDYLFIPLYAITIALGTLLAGGRHALGWIKSLGTVTGWGVLAAAVFDSVENFALWKMLRGALVQPWPEIAAICAKIKFSLILIGLLFTLIAGLLLRIKK